MAKTAKTGEAIKHLLIKFAMFFIALFLMFMILGLIGLTLGMPSLMSITVDETLAVGAILLMIFIPLIAWIFIKLGLKKRNG